MGGVRGPAGARPLSLKLLVRLVLCRAMIMPSLGGAVGVVLAQPLAGVSDPVAMSWGALVRISRVLTGAGTGSGEVG